MGGSVQSFLLAFSALFSIVNPIGGALIFSDVTADRTPLERRQLARRIAGYSALIMLGALLVGTYVLNFFGISLPALRMAGGFVVAAHAWSLLHTPERHEERKQAQAAGLEGVDDVAFFPLTMPFTTGPGTISVAIALGSNLPVRGPGYLSFVIGATAAAVVIALIVWVAYASSEKLMSLLGPARARVLSRLMAFLLLCIGTQITLNGISEYVRAL